MHRGQLTRLVVFALHTDRPRIEGWKLKQHLYAVNHYLYLSRDSKQQFGKYRTIYVC